MTEGTASHPHTAAHDLTVRGATQEHSALIWEWRNDPVTRAASTETAKIPWATHNAWFERVLADSTHHLLVGFHHNEPIAALRFDRIAQEDLDPANEQLQTRWEISINLAPAARGYGYSVPLLEAAARWLRSHEASASQILAEIRTENQASRRAFAKAGYKLASQSEDWIHLSLDIA